MLVFMFPGQSSADPQMLVRASRLHPAAASVAARAAAVLGAECDRYFDPAGVSIACNQDVQVSVFLATQMHLAAVAAEALEAEASAGMSLGEYSHLVHIGALSFENALRIVYVRGALYDQSPPGRMVTILGPGKEEVEQAVRLGGSEGVVVVSNYNSPTQHVISGDPRAVASVARALEEEEGAQAIEIEARVAMHSPLLAAAAEGLRRHLETIPWAAPAKAYVPNVTGTILAHPTPADLVDHLAAHVTRPVQWRRSIERLAATYPGASFVEVGPGLVLHNLLSRRWIDVQRFATDGRAKGEADSPWRQTVEALRARS